MLENTEGAIKNGKSRETDNIKYEKNVVLHRLSIFGISFTQQLTLRRILRASPYAPKFHFQ
jgi:hypothetical protein